MIQLLWGERDRDSHDGVWDEKHAPEVVLEDVVLRIVSGLARLAADVPSEVYLVGTGMLRLNDSPSGAAQLQKTPNASMLSIYPSN